MKFSMRQLTSLLRQCLEAWGTVEIEGVGAFRRDIDGTLRFTPRNAPKVFIAYVQEDMDAANRLNTALGEWGCDPWIDKQKLVPGQNWPRAIEAAIQTADCFVPLFSRHSVVKRSQFQTELRFALDCATRVPLEQPFVVPVRLDACRIPAKVSQSIQYIDLFPDFESGVAKLAASIRKVERKA